ncbi:hypothetical protein ASG25_21895 [Rhizobium sp. Leaf384]|uniref:hypothetical protein n=1 Tax=unclassified Rhizobium TaxID=2613769 RepID=UPI000713556D|nr:MULTISPECIES: hypothetical protein [unclassified Rhizobium]KQS78081.1 hypothetical protein ASG58_06635 [Rhizobium sp. Leaf383]KQS79712.1 hypothetical protein ASG25_21895 [Rhizobium sp. Leaf384]
MNRRSFLKAAPAVVALPAVAFASVTAPEGFHRISVEEGDPGYIPYGMLRGDRKKVSIFLNGQKEAAVVTADAREGWIKRHIRTPDGNYAHARGELLTEVVHGAVVIEISNKDTVK